jgi:hypothetical protein
MLPSTTPSQPIKVNLLILMAYKRAGILPVEATLAGANMTPKLEHGRLVLDTVLDALATEGVNARSLVLHELPIVAGETTYELPDTVLDATGDAMFYSGDLEDFDPKRTESELAVKQIDIATWASLTAKQSESARPQLYTTLRDQPLVRVRVWPTPSANGVLRLRVARLFGGSADGRRPVDLQRYWHDALIWTLASYLATDSSLPTERCAFLGQVAEGKKRAALRYGSEQTPLQAVVDYRTQWST